MKRLDGIYKKIQKPVKRQGLVWPQIDENSVQWVYVDLKYSPITNSGPFQIDG